MMFKSQQKIRFGDIDRAGIVYYPRFFHYFHVALEEFYTSELKIDFHTVIDKHRIGFPVVHLETDFSRPFNYGDDIEVEVSVLQIGNTSLHYQYRAFKKDQKTAHIVGRQITVCMDMDTFKKKPIPEWLRQRLAATLEPRNR